MQTEIYDTDKNVLRWLKSIAKSETRIKILMALNEGGKNLNQLRDEIGLTSSAILHSMRNMGIENLILKTKEGYFLTNIGKSQAILLNGLINSMSALSKTEDFWLNHDISGIPEVLLRGIGDLRDCEVIRGTTTDLFRVHSEFIKILTFAQNLILISLYC